MIASGDKHGFHHGLYENRIIPRQAWKLLNESLGFRLGGTAFTAFLDLLTVDHIIIVPFVDSFAVFDPGFLEKVVISHLAASVD
jgi:hypothetical protein